MNIACGHEPGKLKGLRMVTSSVLEVRTWTCRRDGPGRLARFGLSSGGWDSSSAVSSTVKPDPDSAFQAASSLLTLACDSSFGPVVHGDDFDQVVCRIATLHGVIWHRTTAALARSARVRNATSQ